MTVLQSAAPGAAPQQSAFQLLRASDGKTRVDYGNTSVITDPVARQSIILDHLKKEARVIPLPQPAMPQMAMPQMGMPQFAAPAMPGAPPPPAISVQDLGKSMIEGHEVEGKRYVMQPPALPSIAPPTAPSLALPQLPGQPPMPQAPQMPQIPKPPQPPLPPTVTEVWTSTQLQLPVLTTITGPFGKQKCFCRNAPSGEPHPSAFQIPQGYRPPAPPQSS